MENLTQRWTQSGFLFSKFRALLSIFKKGQGRPPPHLPNWALVNVVEYASISLSIPKYP